MLGAALFLYILGQLPPLIQSKEIQKYQNIEEAEARLGIDIMLPAYYPDYLAFPPARIEVEQEPVLLISLFISSREEGKGILIIREIISHSLSLPPGAPRLKEVWEETEVGIDGNLGTLILGKGSDGNFYNEVVWRAEDRHFILTTTLPPAELLKIAQSLHP